MDGAEYADSIAPLVNRMREVRGIMGRLIIVLARSMVLLRMAAVAVLVGWITAKLLGTAAGVIVGIIVFAGWYPFHRRGGTTGLFRANLRAYFAARRSGRSVDESLQRMVANRYQSSKERRALALAALSQIPPTESDDQKVREAVFMIFCLEQGVPPTSEKRKKYRRQIAEVYGRMAGQPSAT